MTPRKMRVEDVAGGIFDVTEFLLFIGFVSAVSGTMLVTSPLWGPVAAGACAVIRADRRRSPRPPSIDD